MRDALVELRSIVAGISPIKIQVTDHATREIAYSNREQVIGIITGLRISVSVSGWSTKCVIDGPKTTRLTVGKARSIARSRARDEKRVTFEPVYSHVFLSALLYME